MHYFQWWMTYSHACHVGHKKRRSLVQIFGRSVVCRAIYFYLNYRVFLVHRTNARKRDKRFLATASRVRANSRLELIRILLSIHVPLSLFLSNPNLKIFIFLRRSPSWRSTTIPSRKDFGILARGSARKSEYRFQNCNCNVQRQYRYCYVVEMCNFSIICDIRAPTSLW